MKKRNFEGFAGVFGIIFAVAAIFAIILLAAPVLMIIGGTFILNGNTELGINISIEAAFVVYIAVFFLLVFAIYIAIDNKIIPLIIGGIMGIMLWIGLIIVWQIASCNNNTNLLGIVFTISAGIALPIEIAALIIGLRNI